VTFVNRALQLQQILGTGLGGTYAATITSITDGDTLKMDVVVGQVTISSLELDVVARNMPVRLAGCNAAEKSTEAGKAARANLMLLLHPGAQVTLSDVQPYKYGLEIVAYVALPDGQDLTKLLIAGQWVAPWDGVGAKRPVPPWPRTV
jgi:endonuclease YncB( thermonuclease family)